MKIAKLAAAALTLAASPALANDNVVVGANVSGPEGNPVGTIASVADGVAVLDTGKHKVPLGIDAFGSAESGLTITVTKVQLDGMMDAQLAAAAAQRDAALIAGAAVVSAKGVPVGTISTADAEADNFVLETADGPVALKREHFAVDANGALMALFTLDQLTSATAGN